MTSVQMLLIIGNIWLARGAITDLARRTGQSKAEVLRDAVNLYHRAVNEWEENNKGIVFQVPLSELAQDNTTSTQNSL